MKMKMKTNKTKKFIPTDREMLDWKKDKQLFMRINNRNFYAYVNNVLNVKGIRGREL